MTTVITPQRYTQIVTGKSPDLRVCCWFFLCYYIENATILRKTDTFSNTRKIERNGATRVCKSFQTITANFRFKQCILFSARYVSRICSIYVSFFARKVTLALIVSNFRSECIFNPQLGLIQSTFII